MTVNMSTDLKQTIRRHLDEFVGWREDRERVSAAEDEGRASSGDWHDSDDQGVNLAIEADCLIRRIMRELGLHDQDGSDVQPRVLPEVDGLLTCPDCGGHEFSENGSHPCDWSFSEQDVEGKALVLDGSFEWYDGAFVSYECDCGAQFDQLAEGWDTEYS